MVTQWSPGASRSFPALGEYSLGVGCTIRALDVCNSVAGGGGLTRPLGPACGSWLKEAGLGADATAMARRWASAWARTLAKPAGLVMCADCPASELAQRLHSSNSTAWSMSHLSTGTEGSTRGSD